MSEVSLQENLCLQLLAQQERFSLLIPNSLSLLGNRPIRSTTLIDRLERRRLAPSSFVHHLSLLIVKMPPAYSRMSRPDSSTPRGYRTPRGNQKRHAPRGGRPDNPGRYTATMQLVTPMARRSETL